MPNRVDIDDKMSAGQFDIYRATDKKPILTVGGPTVSCEVQSGALVIKRGAEVLYVFAAGQWATVNQPPA